MTSVPGGDGTAVRQHEKVCPTCRGTGRGANAVDPTKPEPCPTCKGSCYVPKDSWER